MIFLTRDLAYDHVQVRMAERSKALRSGRSLLLWAWVRIPLLTAHLPFGNKNMKLDAVESITFLYILFNSAFVLFEQVKNIRYRYFRAK